MFKTREIEGILRNKGYEQGVKHILEVQNEAIRQMNKDLTECGVQLSKIIDTLANVVEGAGIMKKNFEHQMRRLGGLNDDGQDPNTQRLGEE